MSRKLALTLCLEVAVLVLPLRALADYDYKFTDMGGDTFSISTTSIFTSGQALSFTPFTIQGFTFTVGQVSFLSSSNPCFAFGTAGTTFSQLCGVLVPFGGTAIGSSFPNAVAVGTWGSPGAGIIGLGAGNINLFLTSVTISQTAVPEPSSLLLLGSGAVGLLGLRRRKMRV